MSRFLITLSTYLSTYRVIYAPWLSESIIDNNITIWSLHSPSIFPPIQYFHLLQAQLSQTNSSIPLHNHQMYPQFLTKLSSKTTTTTPFNLFTSSFSTTRKASTKLKKPSKAATVTLLKQHWLNSLSPPNSAKPDPESEWVFGIDPDANGALALIRPDRSVEVFDSPHVKVPVGKTVRRRLDAKSIFELLQSFNAPVGTSVYVEQSQPFPQDGNLACWGVGFGYGMWIGILVASGFSVVPVPPSSWKNEFQLSGCRPNKDASRELASALFPSMSSLLQRKKDHGRAEALLIAAYGKGLKLMSHASCMAESKLQ